MKQKIIVFIVGLLLGAIISTGSMYVYSIANNQNSNKMNMQMPDNTQGGTMDQNGGTPPELPGNQTVN